MKYGILFCFNFFIQWMNFILQLFFPQIFAFDWQKIMDVFKEHNFNGTMPKGGKTEVTNMFNKVQVIIILFYYINCKILLNLIIYLNHLIYLYISLYGR